MLELKYSYIGDLMPNLQPVVDQFSRLNGINIKLVRLGWEYAWQDVLDWSFYEQGPDISHIGSTWGSSLIAMESLRPFKPDELRLIGGEQAFLPHCWQSGLNVEKDTVWSLPWLSYTFILAYRRDLLEKANIDEKTAFQSARSLSETVTRLKGKIPETPWLVPVSRNHLDTLHYVASWVWAAGGDFFTADNLQPTFLEPITLDAICSYYELLRSSTMPAAPEDDQAVQNIFMDGNAAVSIMGTDIMYNWFSGKDVKRPDIREKVGFAPILGMPWVGGDNIVIWKQACISEEHEQAAVALAQYLSSTETQRAFAQDEFVKLPTRTDALDALPMQGTQLTNAVIHSLRAGRSYRPMSMWAKIEYQFAHVFGMIGAEVLAGADVAVTVRKHLETHAKWFEIVAKR